MRRQKRQLKILPLQKHLSSKVKTNQKLHTNTENFLISKQFNKTFDYAEG